MDISTGSWFEYLREEVLTEGLRDIGLPEQVIDFIENAMPNAPEKSKMYAGNQWKQWELSRAYFSRPAGHWVTWMQENFEDQIQVNTIPDGGTVARTVTPYRVNRDVGPQARMAYDEETIEQNKKIAFVVQNVKAAFSKPLGTWRKTFRKAVKALSKAGVPSEKVEVVKEHLAATLMSEFRRFWNSYDELFSWLNDEPTNYEMIKGEDNIDSAMNIAVEDLNTREDPEQVIHEFDDGSYWYNLNVSNCPVEGERMGHCGGDSRGVLVSLRKREGKRKASSSYITMTWEDIGNILYQIKGRSNDAPPEETWDHIDWFIKNMGITSVEESGEHSNDYDGFREMNDYLSTRNRGVSFTGAIDEDAIQEAVNEVVNDYDADNSSIDGEVQGPEEHGGDGVYVYMSCRCNIQIDLGWKGFRHGDNEFRATYGPNDGTPDERFETIPANTWGTSARDFVSETEIENIEWDLPGEGEVSWDVRMLTGAQPEGEEINPDAPATAHLEITIYTAEQEGAEDEDTAAQNMRYFGEQVQEQFEDNYAEIHEKIRSKLAEGGYAAKTPYDRERAGMSEMDLENWKIWQDGPRLEFWFRRGKRHDTAVLNSGGGLGSIPNAIKMWAFDENREGHIDGLYSKMFGSRPMGRPGRIENDDLSRNMARNLEKLYSAAETPTGDQQSLPLGDEYKAPAARLVLAKDSRFIILPDTTLRHEQYPAMLTNWKYEIGVDSKSSPEEVEVVKDIVHYFNAHPDMVEEAARETLRGAQNNIKALADVNKESVMSGKWPQHAIRDIDSRFAARAASGSDHWAERVIAITKWVKESFDQMGEVEKWVAWYKFLSPLKQGYFNHARDGDVDMVPGSMDLYMPTKFNAMVQDQMRKLGTYSGTVRDYAGVPTQEPLAGTLGEPRAVEESVEQQIDRIERLLQEKDPTYDLRLYSIKIDVSIEKDMGGEVQETQTEIRGIEGVTTVRTVGDSSPAGRASLATYEIKFELLGSISRVKYRDRILIPGLMKVKGLRILRVSPIHRTNVRGTIRTVRERKIIEEYGMGSGISGFGGMAGAMGGVRDSYRPTVTPSRSIEQVAADWREGSVRVYDVPMDANNMAYHTMVPVEELLDYMGREFRAPMDAFDGMYKNFIKNGAESPVYVAVGKNGRIKVTGNEDLIWFAKKSGLQELPVFFSYQQQV